jgi:iron(III) transport system ATP-binding protein
VQKLRVLNATKRFGSVAAVNDVSFEIEPGQVVTLLGPSGCGKTTTLRMIAGLEQGDAGEIYLGDRLLSAPERDLFVPPEQRSMGMVFQNYAVWPHMTVAENVGFPLKMEGVKPAVRRERVEVTLKLVGLDGFADRPSPMLSGGQQQRVALARALVSEPEVLLLDEPLSNLDARLREELRFELKELQQRVGITTLFVTHDQKEAMVLSDRIIVMNHGHIEQDGEPLDVYLRPRTRFSLEFLGQCNYLPAHVAEMHGGFARIAVPSAGSAELTVHADEPWASGTSGRLSVRSEDITLNAHVNGEAQWRGEVLSAAFMGSEFEYIVSVGGVHIHAKGPKYAPLRAGAAVQVQLRDGACAFWPDEG